MKFRKEQVDDIIVIESAKTGEFSKKLLDLGNTYIIIDVQYNVRIIGALTIYSALVLVRIK